MNGLFFCLDLAHRERHAGVGNVDDHVDLVDVEPLARDRGADVRLVLMIAADELDLHAFGGGIEILDRELRGGNRAGTAEVGIEARHVAEHADLDGSVAVLRVRGAAPAQRHGERRQADH
jgi:hypothetical protein